MTDDEIGPESAEAIRALPIMKIPVALLTGDTKASAMTVASELGISRFRVDLLPEQETSVISAHTRLEKIVAMLGEGIAGAPALSEATVEVAMGEGTDVAWESTDVVLIGYDPMKFVETVRIAAQQGLLSGAGRSLCAVESRPWSSRRQRGRAVSNTIPS